ncbi:MAG: hypothetical protein M1828_006816 [Chrysothrix sp. TS-e1954]|nr:MAG: hypothetical protein M1828_006816 [Chrysothrix sp. TS-e1954]
MTTPFKERSHEFLSFLNASPTPYHAVESAKVKLEAAGFNKIRERDAWSTLKPGGKYYLTRNGSSLAAFAIGHKWRPGNPISMIGTHTDSCCLRLKPVSKKQGDGFLQVGVETYGGGLWHTWFDRDLSLAGRCLIKDKDGCIVPKLVKIDRPLLRIPTLAVHLDRQETFSFNKETQLFPIAGLVAAELDRQAQSGAEGASRDTPSDTKGAASNGTQVALKAMTERHHPYMLDVIAKDAGVDVESILDFEMVLYDTQKACLGGLNEELIFSARVDNLGMSFCAVIGLINSVADTNALEQESTIRLVSLFDHEEIGSTSAQGAESTFLPAVIRRLSSITPSAPEGNGSDDSYEKVAAADDTASAYEQTLAASFLMSADMAHSVNPNYAAKYETDHKPEMNKGTVVKVNANQRYMTNSPGLALIEEVARRAGSNGVPLQTFVVRNDSSCGSTIGPMLAAALGTRTVDVGNAQLSMHSIRETAGTYDVEYAVRLFESFFVHFQELERKIIVD